jgi:hypothetical protein
MVQKVVADLFRLRVIAVELLAGLCVIVAETDGLADAVLFSGWQRRGELEEPF